MVSVLCPGERQCTLEINFTVASPLVTSGPTFQQICLLLFAVFGTVFVDGVDMKVSEGLKPPPKVCVPVFNPVLGIISLYLFQRFSVIYGSAKYFRSDSLFLFPEQEKNI